MSGYSVKKSSRFNSIPVGLSKLIFVGLDGFKELNLGFIDHYILGGCLPIDS